MQRKWKWIPWHSRLNRNSPSCTVGAGLHLLQVRKIPNTIEIEIDSFVTHDGKRVESHKTRVVTTPKRRANVTIEAAAENFEWLLLAAQAEWGTGPKAEKRCMSDEQLSQLPELEPPCKFSKTSVGKLQVYCNYREQGVWKKHQKTVGVNFDSDLSSFEAMTRTCEAGVMDFYRSHHESRGTGHDDEEEEAGAIDDVAQPPLVDVEAGAEAEQAST